MKTPAQPPAKPGAKPPAKPVKKDSGLSLLCFVLLVGATFAAKSLFIVDNDIEIKTKFSGKSWQLNSQTLRKYWADSEKVIGGWLVPLGIKFERDSKQMLNSAGAALTSPQNFCIPTDRIANTLQQHLNPLATEAQTDRHKDDRDRSNSKPQQNSAQTPANWCVTTGIKK